MICRKEVLVRAGEAVVALAGGREGAVQAVALERVPVETVYAPTVGTRCPTKGVFRAGRLAVPSVEAPW